MTKQEKIAKFKGMKITLGDKEISSSHFSEILEIGIRLQEQNPNLSNTEIVKLSFQEFKKGITK